MQHQCSNDQLDELLAEKDQWEKRKEAEVNAVTAECKELLRVKDEYIEKMKGHWWAFEHLEYHSDEMKKETRKILGLMNNDTLEGLKKWLSLYKFDLAQKSLLLWAINENQQWRSWALSTIDAITAMVEVAMQKETHVDRIVGEVRDNVIDEKDEKVEK